VITRQKETKNNPGIVQTWQKSSIFCSPGLSGGIFGQPPGRRWAACEQTGCEQKKQSKQRSAEKVLPKPNISDISHNLANPQEN